MGRPAKYQTQAQRLEARRKHVRENVRLWREKHAALDGTVTDRPGTCTPAPDFGVKARKPGRPRTLGPVPTTTCIQEPEIATHPGLSPTARNVVAMDIAQLLELALSEPCWIIAGEIEGQDDEDFEGPFFGELLHLSYMSTLGDRYILDRWIEVAMGYFPAQLWERTCHSANRDPTIKYAVTALAALHMERSLASEADTSRPWRSFGLLQYHKAIRDTEAIMASPQVGNNHENMEILLTTSVIFAVIELMIGNPRTCILFAEHGITLMNCYMRTLRARSCKTKPFSMQASGVHDLYTTFRRFDMIASSWVSGRKPRFALWHAQLPKAKFEYLEEAISALECLSHRLFIAETMGYSTDQDSSKRVADDMASVAYQQERERAAILRGLEMWETAFVSLLGDAKVTSRQEVNLIDIQWMRYHVGRVMAMTDTSSTSPLPDTFTPMLAKATACARRVYEHSDREKVFLMFVMVLHPMQFVVKHCADWNVREEACEILQRFKGMNMLDESKRMHG